MANIRIRAVEPSDAEALNEIFNCPGVIAGTLQLPFRSLEFSRERLAQRSPDAHYLGAEIGGRVVGNLGLRRVELTVFIDNAPAIHLYETFGFTIEGAARQFALRNGEYVDAYTMARVRPFSRRPRHAARHPPPAAF